MDRSALHLAKLTSFLAVSSCSLGLLAQEAPAAVPAPAKPKPPPYSLPWQLRPAVVGNVVRSDTAVAFYKDAAGKESGSTVASMLLASYKITDESCASAWCRTHRRRRR
jgi:hypothetical protein